MLLITKSDIQHSVNMRDMIEADKAAFSMTEKEKIDSPIRTSIDSRNGGCFLFMPSYSPETNAAAIKIVGFFPDNVKAGLATNPGQILLIDGDTGYIKAVLDGTYITQLRTGGASGAAFDLLAKKDCRTGVLIGTGGQAAAQLEAMLCARKLEKVYVCGRNTEKCIRFAEVMNEKLSGYGAKILAVRNADEYIPEADLIITVTTSETPVFDGRLVKKGATVSCVGTFEPNKHELDPNVLTKASKIFCDSVQAVLSESGDIIIPMRDGLISEKNITGGLGEVINGTKPGRENDEEIIVFETVGISAQDLVSAEMIYERAAASGFGTEWKPE